MTGLGVGERQGAAALHLLPSFPACPVPKTRCLPADAHRLTGRLLVEKRAQISRAHLDEM